MGIPKRRWCLYKPPRDVSKNTRCNSHRSHVEVPVQASTVNHAAALDAHVGHVVRMDHCPLYSWGNTLTSQNQPRLSVKSTSVTPSTTCKAQDPCCPFNQNQYKATVFHISQTLQRIDSECKVEPHLKDAEPKSIFHHFWHTCQSTNSQNKCLMFVLFRKTPMKSRFVSLQIVSYSSWKSHKTPSKILACSNKHFKGSQRYETIYVQHTLHTGSSLEIRGIWRQLPLATKGTILEVQQTPHCTLQGSHRA